MTIFYLFTKEIWPKFFRKIKGTVFFLLSIPIFFFLSPPLYSYIQGNSPFAIIRDNLRQSFKEEKKIRTQSFFLEEEQPFFVLTLPKSGTHLFMKMLDILTDKEPSEFWRQFPSLNIFRFPEEIHNRDISSSEIERAFSHSFDKNCYPIAHFNFGDLFYNFSLAHPTYVKLLLIRDLRDIYVSSLFFQSKKIKEVTGLSSFDDQLTFLLSMGEEENLTGIFNIEKFAKKALKWMEDSQAIVCRFEDLVGERGGGTAESQKKLLETIATALKIILDDEDLDLISEELFGIEEGMIETRPFNATFRKGMIGESALYFNEKNKKIFNENLGKLQTTLGYPLFEVEANLL